MKNYALLALTLPSAAFAATSDPGGVATLIFLGFMLALGLWVLIAFGIARFIPSSTGFRLLIGTAIAATPFALLGIDQYIKDRDRNELERINTRLSATANDYMLDACKHHRRAISNHKVNPRDGVRLTVKERGVLSLAVAPPEASNNAKRSAQEVYSGSDPWETHSRQYVMPLQWGHRVYPGSILAGSKFPYAEFDKPSSKGASTHVEARRQWWREQAVVQVTNQAELDRHLQNSTDRDNDFISLQTTSSTAKYELTITEISTVTDRSNWVARGQIRLTKRETGEVVAEYVGFAANRFPAHRQDNYHPAWDTAVVCPGPERKFERDRAPWDMAGFFFGEIVQYEGEGTL